MKNSTILHIPHASTTIPSRYRGSFDPLRLPHELRVMTDWFCDELFDCGRDRLVFPISRLICDVERFRDDRAEIMSRVGMGAVYQNGSDLLPLRHIDEKEKQQILRAYYDVHHRKFTDEVAARLKRYNQCLIVDGHSFYPTALPYEPDQSADRPDFCIGTSDYHTPRKVAEAAVKFLKSKGFRVKMNAPFAGTIVPMKFYETDPRVSSVMIEVNRKLYLSPSGGKSEYFLSIRRTLRECIERMEQFI